MIIQLHDNIRSCLGREDIFDAILNLDGEVYRRQKNRRTLRITIHDRGYFAKIHEGTSWQEILKNIFQLRLPIISAMNEVRAIQRMEGLGIPTMRIAGYGMRGLPPAWLDSFVITEELTNTISIEDFCRDWKSAPPAFALKYAVIRKVAEIAATMHRNGVNHRDFYLCHFLLDCTSLQTTQQPVYRTPAVERPPVHQANLDNLTIYLIDLHRVQLRKKTPQRWIIKDLSGLLFSAMDIGLTRRDIYRFMSEYTGKTLREMLGEDRQFWLKVYCRAQRLYTKHFHCSPPLTLEL